MSTTQLFEKLWKDYSLRTPSAEKVKHLFESEGNQIINDHIAFRTFDDPRINIDALATVFINNGYVYKNDYHFTKKKLYAKHFEHKTDKTAPLIFISQLITSEFSSTLKDAVSTMLDDIDFNTLNIEDLVLSGRLWGNLNYSLYANLLKESEYAAWLYVNGFCANHFTVSVNHLDTFNDLKAVNTFLKTNGFKMNASGGEIKGNSDKFLEQSSILADKIWVEFEDGKQEITSCYYEFAYRYKQGNELFKGFIADSADKIFESTNMNIK